MAAGSPTARGPRTRVLRASRLAVHAGLVATGLCLGPGNFAAPASWSPRRTVTPSPSEARTWGSSRVSGRRSQPSFARALPEAFSFLASFLDQIPAKVAEVGPLGPVYFFIVYVALECLAVPATPLTLSAGYLFGLPGGCAMAVLAGVTAAAIAFTASRAFFRPQILKMAKENETFQKINKAVEREGFKIILLLRLSPLLPFSLSNYVFALSSVPFQDFLLATIIGMTPNTCGIVYFASTARALATEGGADQPWYMYAAGAAFSLGLLKLVTDVAKKAVDDAVKAEEAEAKAAGRV